VQLGWLAGRTRQRFSEVECEGDDELKLLWIACGVDDRLIELNRKLRAWLEAKGVRKVDIGDAWRAYVDGLAAESFVVYATAVSVISVMVPGEEA